MSSDNPNDTSGLKLELSLEGEDDGETKSAAPVQEEPKKEEAPANPPEAPQTSGFSLSLDDDSEEEKVEAIVSPPVVEEKPKEESSPIEEPSSEPSSQFDLSLNIEEEVEAPENLTPQENVDSLNSENEEESNLEDETSELNSAFASRNTSEDESTQEEDDTDVVSKPSRSNDPYSNEVTLVPTKRKFSFENLFSFIKPSEEIGVEEKPKISRTKIIALVGSVLLLVLIVALQPGSPGGRMEMDINSPETLTYLLGKQEAISAPKKPPAKIEEIVLRTWTHDSNTGALTCSIIVKTENDKISSFYFKLKTDEPSKRTPEQIVDGIQRDPWLHEFTSNEIVFLPNKKKEINESEEDEEYTEGEEGKAEILRFEGTGDGRAFIRDDIDSNRIIATFIGTIKFDKKNDKLWGNWKIIHSMTPDQIPNRNYAKRISAEDFELYYLGEFTTIPTKTIENLQVKTKDDQSKLKEVIKK